ncbi:MAG: DEAD/DEAH box helicase [bacterium]
MSRIDTFIRQVTTESRFASQVAVHRYLPPAQAQYGDLRLNEGLRKVLEDAGVSRVWSHQKEAVEAIRSGMNVVVMTPTASGKTLIYTIPVIESILGQPESTALYIFPLKGLEQDQVNNLNSLLSALDIRPERKKGERTPLQAAEIYDGDTPAHRRKKIRERTPNVIFTNPDMLHLAINPFHAKWEGFFRHLRYVVIDEIHSYRGVFGSNAAHVFRRLRRICRYYGSSPLFITSSATIANPRELAENLIGLPFREISESGAPLGGKHFIFVNPPPDRSPYTETTHLFVSCLRAGLRTILFTRARKITELIYTWAVQQAGELAPLISPYRSGFLPKERRIIEQRLFQGELMGVVTTSALELGIDIGGLDVCILAGYPGSIASTWQRAGRVGRHGDSSAVLMVAIRDALDQYFMRHPDAFFGKSHEEVIVDPNNPRLLKRHLPCAAAEIYLREDDPVYDVPALKPLIEELAASGEMNPGKRGDIWFPRNRHPQREVGIRSIGEPWGIFLESGERIGELDATRVFGEAFPGAIYLHQGRQYRITRLDPLKKRALCTTADVHYYTHALSSKQTRVLSEEESQRLPALIVHRGNLAMTQRVTGYERRRMYDGTRISRHTLDMPESRFDTEGLWMALDQDAMRTLASNGHDLAGSLHAVEHAAIKCIPLFAICDKGDIGGLSYASYPVYARPTIFIYDGYEGGIGFTKRGFHRIEDLLKATLALIRECPCEGGCPACVQDPLCGSGNDPLDKKGAILVLSLCLGPASSAKPDSMESAG